MRKHPLNEGFKSGIGKNNATVFRNIRAIVLIIGTAVLFISNLKVSGQTPDVDGRRFEAGGQLSLISLSRQTVGVGIIDCFPAPCPNPTRVFEVGQTRTTIGGIGGRFGYNFSDHFALEAESNFFPGDSELEGGRKLQAVFGLKAGQRFDKVGLFVKARPGFVRYEKGDFQTKPDTLCIAIFPPPLGCFDPVARTNFAFDVGGVVELYPTKRTLVRVEAGDTIIRLQEHNTAVLLGIPNPITPSVLQVPAKTTHNFQASVGFGFRF